MLYVAINWYTRRNTGLYGCACTGLVNDIGKNFVTSIALHAGLKWFPTVSRIHSAIRTREYSLYTHLLVLKIVEFHFFLGFDRFIGR